MDRKKILLIGTNGSIAHHLLPLLLKHYEVHCLIRSPATFGINSIFLKFIEGDALDPLILDQALPGKEAVITLLAPRPH